MRNKIVALFMALAMAFSFAACSGDDGDSKSAPETVTITETATPETPSAPETTEEFTPESPGLDTEALFLQVIEDEFPNHGIPEQTLLNIAYGNCDLWDAGFTFEEIAQIGLDEGVSPEFVGYMVGAGTQAFCPEHAGKVG